MNTNPRVLTVRDYLDMGIAVAGLRTMRFPRPRYRVVFRLNMRNNSSGSIRLIGRKWVLRDHSGNTRIVEAENVFNRQPILTPGAVFSYGGCQEFDSPPAGLEVSFFGTDAKNSPFITPPLVFPRRSFRLPR